MVVGDCGSFFSVKQVDSLVERRDEEEQLGFQEMESMK